MPPSAAVPADPVGTLRARHETLGLRIHAHTGTPSWQGERLNVAYAIDVLHPLAIEPLTLSRWRSAQLVAQAPGPRSME